MPNKYDLICPSTAVSWWAFDRGTRLALEIDSGLVLRSPFWPVRQRDKVAAWRVVTVVVLVVIASPKATSRAEASRSDPAHGLTVSSSVGAACFGAVKLRLKRFERR